MARKKRLNADAIIGNQGSCALGQDETKNHRGDIYQTAAYIRLSAEDSGKKDGYSLQNQEMLVLDYIGSHPELNLYREYVDNGFSGTCFDRPAFDEMMQDMRDGRINCIVVKDLSRLGRNYLEAGNYLEQIFPFFKVRFISINDGYDSTAPNSADESLIIPLKNIINEGYAKDISVKVSTALETRKKQGKFTGKYAPYGYLKDPADKNHLIIDEETKDIVKRIFQMRADGMSMSGIAVQLNQEGIPSPAAYLILKGISKEKSFQNSYWNRTNVKRLLTNRMYLGNLVYGKEQSSFAKGITRHRLPEEQWKEVENTHEPIIDRKLFDFVQEKQEESRKEFFDRTGINDDYQPENLFRGLIHCSDCGGAMKMSKFVTTLKSGKQTRFAVYECCRRKSMKNYSCPPRSIRKTQLDQTVAEAIRYHISLFLDTEKVIETLNQKAEIRQAAASLKNQIREMQRQAARYERMNTGMYEDYRDGILDESEYLAMRKHYSEEADRLREEIDRMITEQDSYAEDYRLNDTLSDLVRKYAEFTTLTREIVEAFIADIRVHTGGGLKIVFRFEDELKQLTDLAEKRREKVQHDDTE